MTLLILRGAHADYSHGHHRHHPLHLPILYCPEETKRQRMSPVSQVWEKEELGRLDLFHYVGFVFLFFLIIWTHNTLSTWRQSYTHYFSLPLFQITQTGWPPHMHRELVLKKLPTLPHRPLLLEKAPTWITTSPLLTGLLLRCITSGTEVQPVFRMAHQPSTHLRNKRKGPNPPLIPPPLIPPTPPGMPLPCPDQSLRCRGRSLKALNRRAVALHAAFCPVSFHGAPARTLQADLPVFVQLMTTARQLVGSRWTAMKEPGCLV